MQAESLYRRLPLVGGGKLSPSRLDPSCLRVLVVDSQASSRREVAALLRECSYQVTEKRNTKDVLELPLLLTNGERTLPFDIVLKDHEPPRSNACRLLREFAQDDGLKATPVVVFSTQDDRERIIECLQLGACDYLVKPLRKNELRNLWTRVWRQVAPTLASLDAFSAPRLSSQESQETKCEEDDEPASKEGSATGQEGCGSKEGNGNSRDKEGSGNRYQSTGVVSANSPMDSGKHQDGSGQNGNGGSNGNGASTTLKPDRQGALIGTAEGGKAAPAMATARDMDHRQDRQTIARPTPTRYSPLEQLVGAKRSASEMAGSDAPGSLSPPETERKRRTMAGDGMQSPSGNGPGSTSCHISDGTHQASVGRCSGHQGASPSILPGLSPQMAGFPFPMQSGPGIPFQGSPHWPGGVGTQESHPGEPSDPPWGGAGAAMMQYLLGPFNSPQLMMQIQLLAEKSGIPSHILLQQVMADSSQLLGLLAGQLPAGVGPSAALPNGQPPMAPPFPPVLPPAAPGGLPLMNSLADAWKADRNAQGQRETAQQRQNAIMMELIRQQQQQQQHETTLLMQSLQFLGSLGSPNGLGGHMNSTFSSSCAPPPPHAVPSTGPPAPLPTPSVTLPSAGKMNSETASVDKKGKSKVTDQRKKRRQAALDKFREKRKNRNSSNTIRYPGRRELAQNRPRSRGQFVSYKRGEDEHDPQDTQTNGQSKPVEDGDEMADGGTSCAPKANERPSKSQGGGGHQHQGMLPIGVPGRNPRLCPPGSMPFAKQQDSSVQAGAPSNGNSGRNSSDSGSNCPDMQIQDK